MKNNEFKNTDFINDKEKMRDFKILSKEEFLESYSYLTEEEYDNTYNKYYATKNTFHWIPIEKELPEEDKNVLLTFLAYPDYKKPRVDSEFAYLHNGEWYWVEENEEDTSLVKVPVVAWMAIEPYKEDNQQNQNKEEIEMNTVKKEINETTTERDFIMSKLVPLAIKAKLSQEGWTIKETEKGMELSAPSKLPHNFCVEVTHPQGIEDVVAEVEKTVQKYDVSQALSYWLDADGNGTNGAPKNYQETYWAITDEKDRLKALLSVLQEETQNNNNIKQKIVSVNYLLKNSLDFVCENSKPKEFSVLKQELADTINDFETYADISTEFFDFVEAAKDFLNLPVLKQIAESYVFLLSRYKKTFDKVWKIEETTPEEFERDLKPLNNFLKKVESNFHCPHCGEVLFKSDLPDYNYVCANCDENFYSFEVLD